MILRKILSLLSVFLPFVFADVEFVAPAAGDSIPGLTLSIQWQDSGLDPPLTDLSTYQMFLCAGGNAAGSYV
jgi:hypothetical protein